MCIGSWTPKATLSLSLSLSLSLRVCNPYCFSNARMVERRSLNVTLICTLLVSFISTRGQHPLIIYVNNGVKGRTSRPVTPCPFSVCILLCSYTCRPIFINIATFCNVRQHWLERYNIQYVWTGQSCSDTVKPAYKGTERERVLGIVNVFR